MGKSISSKLANLGCNLVIVERDLSRIKDVEHDLKSLGVNVVTLEADVTKFEEVCRVQKILSRSYANVDFLVSIGMF